jgi:hypothetical protein
MSQVKLPAELERLVQDAIIDFGMIIRRVAIGSAKFGADATQAAVKEAISNWSAAAMQSFEANKGLEEAKAAAKSDGVIPAGEYGAVAQAIKMALRHFGTVKDGVTVPQLLQQIHRMGAHAITEQQVRNTLKGLIKSEVASNPSRGHYRAGPRLPDFFVEAA